MEQDSISVKLQKHFKSTQQTYDLRNQFNWYRPNVQEESITWRNCQPVIWTHCNGHHQLQNIHICNTNYSIDYIVNGKYSKCRESWINPLKTKRRPLYLKPSSYRAVNTFLLGYKNQSVYAISGTSRCLYLDKYKAHKYSVGRAYNCWMLNCWFIKWPVGFKRLNNAPILTADSGTLSLLTSDC